MPKKTPEEHKPADELVKSAISVSGAGEYPDAVIDMLDASYSKGNFNLAQNNVIKEKPELIINAAKDEPGQINENEVELNEMQEKENKDVVKVKAS